MITCSLKQKPVRSKAGIKITAIALISSVSLTSCLTAKKLDKEMGKQYGWQMTQSTPRQKDFITVKSNLPAMDNTVSKSASKTSNMLPLLVYWQWDYTVSCAINPLIPVNSFTKTVSAYAEKDLKKKLDGRRVEISIDKIPDTFSIVDEAHLVWIIYAIGWDKIYITPVNKELEVSYKVMDGDTEVKKGTISVPGFDKRMQLGMFKSWKTATSDYLYQYDANIQAISKMVIDRLVEEL